MSLNQYEQEMVADQLLDTDFLMNQMPLNDIHFQTHDGSFILSQPTKGESFEPGYMGSYSESDQQPDPRSYSCSSTTSQSLSPTLHHSPPELYGLQITRPPFSTWPEQKSPSTTDPSKKESDDEDHRTVRRRAQNRAAQRAYRQRKDHSLKQREREVDSLREELDKAQRLNKSLCQAVSVLRERLKETPEAMECDNG